MVDKVLEAVAEVGSKDFQWGVLDCAIFAGEVAKIVHGINIVDEFKFAYNSELGARKWLKKRGYKNLKDAVTDLTKKSPVNTTLLEDGDIVIGNSPYEKHLKYCLGIVHKNYAFFTKEQGSILFKVRLDTCVCGWNLSG